MKVGDKKNFGRLATIFQIFSMDATDFGMARDVQQENIYEQKTKVIMNNGRWGRHYISVSYIGLRKEIEKDIFHPLTSVGQ